MIYFNTIEKIKKLNKEKKVEKLAHFLSHRNDEVRKAALLSLVDIGYKSAIYDIQEMLKSEEDEFVQKIAKNAIEQLNSNGIVDKRYRRTIEVQRANISVATA